MSKIVIGDVHGCFESLKALIKQFPHDNICFVGDLVDRGPSSREVVELVKSKGYDCVMGNHEQFMIEQQSIWRHPRNGGDKTIVSYKEHQDLFKEHCAWFETLPDYIEYHDIKNDDGEYLLISHSFASQCWNNKDSAYFKEVIKWGRSWSEWKPIPGIFNIFGHTPMKEVKTVHRSVCVDTGCCYDLTLSAIEFPSMNVFTQKCIDPIEVPE